MNVGWKTYERLREERRSPRLDRKKSYPEWVRKVRQWASRDNAL